MHFKFWDKVHVSDNLKAVDRLTACLAEFFGTAILMFVGCMGCVNNENRKMMETALSFGFAFMMAIQCFGHISGAHVNPILTLAALLTGNLALVEVPIYWIGQFFGSVAGFGLVKLLVPRNQIFTTSTIHDRVPPVCCAGMSTSIEPGQGVMIEMFITFVLVTVACAIWDKRNSAKTGSVSVSFGIVVGVITLAAGPLTGGHMNPARTLGPSILNNYWDNHWIFWVGPFVGSFLGAAFYNILYSDYEPESEEDE